MTLTKATYERLYDLLSDAAPLEYDCGILCGRACCQGGRDLGIYLFPGEEQLFTGAEDWLVWQVQKVKFYDFPPSWEGTVNFINCTKPCPRERRPLQCRFYPLAPHVLADGSLLIIMDPVPVPYSCPLITQKLTLRSQFVQRVYEAWKILLEDSKIRDLVVWDSRERESRPDFIPTIILAEDTGGAGS
jgi:hypothetical protein